MKNDFKIGQTVISKKPGILNGISGEILSINPENRKQLTIVCGNLGTWSLSFDEVESETKIKNTVESVEKSVTPIAEIKVKRPYVKRGDKPKGVKTKRKYTKKNNQL